MRYTFVVKPLSVIIKPIERGIKDEKKPKLSATRGESEVKRSQPSIQPHRGLFESAFNVELIVSSGASLCYFLL